MKKLINLIVFILIAGLNGWAQEATEVIRVACVGNSITFGAGIANRDRDSYPSVLGQMLGRGYEVRKSNCLFYKHLIFMYFCPIINF